MLLITILIFPACPPRNMQLNESLFYYNNSYRWKRTDVSSDFVHPLYKQSLLKSLRAQEKGISISDLEIEDVFVNNEKGIALVKIRLSYLMANETILREESISQYWLKEDSKWFFVGQIGSDKLSIPIPDKLKSQIFSEDQDATSSDN